jgi:hypothetical protein
MALTGVSIGLLLSLATLPASAAAANRVTNAKYGYTIVLPKSWNEVSLNSQDLGAILGDASKISPTFKQDMTAQVQSAAAKGLKTFATSSIPEDGAFFPNVNVGVFPGSASLGEMDAQVKIQLTAAGAKHVKTKMVHFKFGRAVEGTYSLAVASSGKNVYGTQVYVSHGGNIYITTFSAIDQAVESKAAATVMPTWRFTKKG